MNTIEQIGVPSCSATAYSFGPSNKRKKHNEIKQLWVDNQNERNIIYKGQTQYHDDDDVDLFFKSIAMSVKKLKPELINEAKMKSLQMVINLERRDI